jgi:Methionine synthase I (cobalamin-dependent), methyltransferase domain
MALAGARIARAAADRAGRKVWVAGSVGPTSKSLTLAPDINRPAERPYSFDQMAESYREQVEALLEGGVDLLLIETAFDALNVKAALYAVQQVREGFPVIVSVSVSDRSGRTLTGQTLEAFFTAVRHYPLTAFGVNCSLGADELLPLVKDVAAFSDVPVICYPNAGASERARRIRPDAGGDGGAGGPDGRHRQHPGRLLRHHAGAYQSPSGAVPRPAERVS